jgi:aspartate aminotransferase
MNISTRAKNLAVSATLEVTNKAAELRRAGIDVIGFGAGEPDFPTPDHVKAAGIKAIEAGHTGYAKPTHGIPEARAAVCEKFHRENRLNYKSEQVVVTVGGKEALFLACAAVLDAGDEVLLPVPYWVSFPEQIKLCDAKVVFVRSKDPNDLRLRPEQIAAAVTRKTKMLIFNSPSNPGGFAYSPDEVRAIAQALRGRDIMVFSDEMYDQLRFGDRREHLSFAAVDEEWYLKTITFNAASKTHAMTGWRVGYAAGPVDIIKAMAKIQSHTTSGTATFVQHALVEALTGDQSHVEERRREFERRGLHMHARLNAMAGVTCVQPSGAFYCFPNVTGAFRQMGVRGSAEFCNCVLEQAHVALVPGIAFGSDDHVRLSFATSMQQIDRGLDRLEKLLGRA